MKSDVVITWSRGSRSSARCFRVVRMSTRRGIAIAAAVLVLLGTLAALTIWAGTRAFSALRLHHDTVENASLREGISLQHAQMDSLLERAIRLRDWLRFSEASIGVFPRPDPLVGLDSLARAHRGASEAMQPPDVAVDLDGLLKVLRERARSADSIFQAKRLQLAHLPQGLPVEGPITSGFGLRRNPFEKGGPKTEMHEGVDLARPNGSPVYATASGKVFYAGWAKGYGNLVILDHQNGFFTYYAHNSGFQVEEGEHVERGQVIALVGSTGRSTAPHSHYEVRRGDQPEDPLEFNGVC